MKSWLSKNILFISMLTLGSLCGLNLSSAFAQTNPVVYGQEISLALTTRQDAGRNIMLTGSAEQYTHPNSSGLGQVFGSTNPQNNDDVWIIEAPRGKTLNDRNPVTNTAYRGSPLKHANVFRLKHKNTGKTLHYKYFASKSPDGQHPEACLDSATGGTATDDLQPVVNWEQNGQTINQSNLQNIPWLEHYDKITIRPKDMPQYFYYPTTKYTNNQGQQYVASWIHSHNARGFSPFPFFKITQASPAPQQPVTPQPPVMQQQAPQPTPQAPQPTPQAPQPTPQAPQPAPSAPEPVTPNQQVTPAPITDEIFANVWAIDTDNKVLFREGISQDDPIGTSWSEVTGLLASDISVGPDGKVWALDTTNGGGGHQIYFREGITDNNPKGTSWAKIDGALVVIGTGQEGQLWGVNDGDTLFFREGITQDNPKGTSWKFVNQNFKYVDAGANNSVWATGTFPGVVYRHWGNTTTQPGSTWSPVERYEIKQIAVGPNGQAWGINASNEVVGREGVANTNPKGTSWKSCATDAKFVGVTKDNQIWMVKNDNSIWASQTADVNDMQWEQVSGRLIKITGGGMPTGYAPQSVPTPEPTPAPEPESKPEPTDPTPEELAEIATFQSELKKLDSESRSRQGRISELTKQESSLEKQLDELEEQIEEKRKELENILDSIEQAEKRLEELDALRDEITEKTAELAGLEQQRQDKENELTSLSKKVKAEEENLTNLVRSRDLKRSKNALEDALDDLELSLAQKTIEGSGLINNLQAAFAQLQPTMAQLHQQISAINLTYANIGIRLQSTRGILILRNVKQTFNTSFPKLAEIKKILTALKSKLAILQQPALAQYKAIPTQRLARPTAIQSQISRTRGRGARGITQTPRPTASRPSKARSQQARPTRGPRSTQTTSTTSQRGGRQTTRRQPTGRQTTQRKRARF
ncbi:MAG: hypothetical protein H6679_00285 [Epsilonproteobacteria bacterium]|nr:hypothetical protein [Campylobacterota bacterium]